MMIAYDINPATKDVFERTCQRCSDGITQMQTEKIIRNMVRMPASLQTLNVATCNVYNNTNKATDINWNQMSDRNVAHVQKVVVPSRGDSTRSTLTRARPGACSAGGAGVDVKHGSYDRYLARIRGKSCNPVKTSTDVQILTSTFDFVVGNYCWALRYPPIGPFYKAIITNIAGNVHTIQFIVNGVPDPTTETTRHKNDLLVYTCSC
jgi:hypothetical protein